MRRIIVTFAVAACIAGTVIAGPLRDAPLRIFDATELTPDRYTVVRRVWVEDWRSAFWIKGYPDSAAALAALSAEAERAGGNAMTNVTCLNDDRAGFNRGYFCYGLAIRLK